MPISSKATGKADLSFTGTDFANATGSVNAQLTGAAPAGSDLAPLSGEVAVTANRGQFQIQRATLQTPATTLNATGQFSIDQPISNLRHRSCFNRRVRTSAPADFLRRDSRTGRAVSKLTSIDLGGQLAFNGTLTGALKDPIVNGHAELGSLMVNQRDVGSLTANIASTATETRITDGRLVQASGGNAQFCAGDAACGQGQHFDRRHAGSF